MAPAAAIAIEAGLLIHDFHMRGVRTEYKGDVDLVTEADRASEKLIVEKLHETFPSHGIYGEEGTRARLDAEYRWYVDPLDGTTNFAHGFPYFCVSLGLEHRPAGLAPDQDGEIVAGVIYQPVHNELFVAEKGSGAYLNGCRRRRICRRRCWLPDSPATSGTRTRTSTSTSSSRCARMACDARARRRWTWRILRRGASMRTGSSI